MHAAQIVELSRKYPFDQMRIDEQTILEKIDGRQICKLCNRSRKFFCYSCYVPVGDLNSLYPHVDIPVNIDIIKHKKEIDGKSTAVHAAVLASERVKIHTYPDIPNYLDEDGVILVFPGATSITVAQLFNRKVVLKRENELPPGHNIGTMWRSRLKEVIEEEETETNLKQQKIYDYTNLPVKRAVFIDSTWNQSRGIFKDERIRSLKTVVLQNRNSQFWRHQSGSPRWYLATIESIHQFLLELHIQAWGLNPNYRGLDNLELSQSFYDTIHMVVVADDNETARNNNSIKVLPYDGQYDNLMFFFVNMYNLIHKEYDHKKLKSYKRPI